MTENVTTEAIELPHDENYEKMAIEEAQKAVLRLIEFLAVKSPDFMNEVFERGTGPQIEYQKNVIDTLVNFVKQHQNLLESLDIQLKAHLAIFKANSFTG